MAKRSPHIQRGIFIAIAAAIIMPLVCPTSSAHNEIQDTALPDVLTIFIESGDIEQREAAAERLVDLGEVAVEGLVRILKENKPDVAARAAEVLGKIGRPAAVTPLIDALKHADSGVRSAAACALGMIGDTRALDPLFGVLGDRESSVRRSAIGALEKITGEEINFRKILDEKKVRFEHPPFKEKKCTACHDPHASSQAGFLKKPAGEVCFECHKETGSRVYSAKYLHRPVKENRCAACHDAHGSNYPKLLVAYFPEEYYLGYAIENYNLCWQCHERRMTLAARTTRLTRFRNGSRNLHYVHVNKRKGRSCKACHGVHSGSQEKHIFTRRHGSWRFPVVYTMTPTGGSCVVGCHRELAYDRDRPVSRR